MHEGLTAGNNGGNGDDRAEALASTSLCSNELYILSLGKLHSSFQLLMLVA